MDQDSPGGCEIVRQAFLRNGTPYTAIEAMLASLSSATMAQYSKPLRLWWQFCTARQEDPFAASIPSILEFLSTCLETTGSYSSLNTYRSAISLISAEEVGSHPLIKRFFKGVAALKPQRPCYDFVWDPSPVMNYLVTLYPYDGLSLDLISKKLVTLLALTTAQRMQTLAAIQCSNIVIADSMIIRIPARLKTSGIGRSQPMLVFKPLLDKPELCVFSLAKHYLMLSQGLRQDNCDAFFISFRKPHHAVSSQTLGRWVKEVLNIAGIDVSIFSAHSTRHASTSLAASKGVNIDEIRRTAGWRKSSDVFARFYNRPIVKDPDFQTAILEM